MNLTPVQTSKQDTKTMEQTKAVKQEEAATRRTVNQGINPAAKASLGEDSLFLDGREPVYKVEEPQGQEAEYGEEKPADANKEVSNLTADDVEAMDAAGMTLEKYELTQLARAIERMKSQREEKQDAAKSYRQQTEQRQEDYEQMALRTKLPKDVSEYVYDRLVAMDIPITDENLEHISQGLERTQTIGQLNESGVAYLLRADKGVSIQNLYAAAFCDTNTSQIDNARSTSLDTNVWQDLQKSCVKLLEQNGYEPTPERLAMCRWMMDEDIAITADHIKQYDTIQAIGSQTRQDQVDCILCGMTEGETIENTVMDPKPYQRAIAAVAKWQFGSVSDEVLSQEFKKPSGQYELQELRYRLTIRVAYSMERRGISVDTQSMEELLDRLRGQQEMQMKELLESGGKTVTKEEVSICDQVDQAVHTLNQSPIQLLATWTFATTKLTLSDAAVEGARLSFQYEQSLSMYEQMGTQVRMDLGDSLHKAWESTDALLEQQNIEVNEANSRAVRSLVYNQMEVTKESVEQVVSLDETVTTVIRQLTPAITLSLIRKKQNPLQMPIEELSDMLQQYQEENPDAQMESYSKYLWKLDKNDDISKEEREAYIGIFRLIHQIESSDGAAIGAVAKAGQEVTLRNLLTQVRSAKHYGQEWKVDDTFGTLENLVVKGKDILSQVGDYMEPYYEEKAARYRQVVTQGERATRFLEAQSIPTTLEYMEAYQSGTILGQDAFQKALKLSALTSEEESEYREQLTTLVDAMENEDSFQSQWEQTDTYLQELLIKHQNQSISYEEIRSIQSLQGQLHLHTELAGRRNYDIPVFTGDNVTNMNVTIMHTQTGKGKVHIAFEGTRLGIVSADFTCYEDAWKGMVMCESRAGMDALQAVNLESKLVMEGYSVTSLQYGILGGNKSPAIGTLDEEPNNLSTLLRFSKLLVKEFAEADKEEEHED